MSTLHESPQQLIENIRNSNDFLQNEINFRRSSVHKITIKKQVQKIVENIKIEKNNLILPLISKTEPFNRNSARRKSVRYSTIKRNEMVFPKSNSCVNIKDSVKNYDPTESPDGHISTNGKRFGKRKISEVFLEEEEKIEKIEKIEKSLIYPIFNSEATGIFNIKKKRASLVGMEFI
jgi:hypothetical protein